MSELIAYDDVLKKCMSVMEIQGRPASTTTNNLYRQLSNVLRGIKCYQAADDQGWVGMIQSPGEYALNNANPFVAPTAPADLTIPAGTDRAEQSNLERIHQRDKNRHDSYVNISQAIRETIERCLPKAYRPQLPAGADTWSQSWTVQQIMAAINQRYGRPSESAIADMKKAFASPFNQNDPIEPFFENINDCQIIAIAAEIPFTTEQLIQHVVSTLNRCPLYRLHIKEWKALRENQRNTWQACRDFFTKAYEVVHDELNNQITTGAAHYGGNVVGDDDSIVTLQEDIEEVKMAYNSVAQTTNSAISTITDATQQNATAIAQLSQQVAAMAMMRAPHGYGGFAAPPAYGAYAAPTAPFQAPPPAAPPMYAPAGYQGPPSQVGGGGGRGGGGRRNRRSNRGGRGAQQQAPPTGIPPYQAGGGAIPPYQPPPQQSTQRRGYQSNPVKRFPNWFVCYSCGFDVDHESHQCNATWKKADHQNGFTRANYLQYEQAGYPFCRKGMHKNQFPAGS